MFQSVSQASLVEKNVVLHIIAETFGIALEQVNEELTYQSISQWDSLGHINLMLALEKKLGIKIDKNNVLELDAVKKIISFVNDNHVPVAESVMTSKSKIHRGLNNIYFDKTKIALIDAENSRLYYRGYSIDELAESARYEEVAYLLLHGMPPLSHELEVFSHEISSQRELPVEIMNLIQTLVASDYSVMNVLMTATVALSNTMEKYTPHNQIMAYFAKLPTILGVYYAYKNKRPWNEGFKNTSEAAYLLYCLLGKLPESKIVRFFEKNLILQAEHDSNASTFSARVAIGAEASVSSALFAAMSTFRGNLHGGALVGVLDMLEEINDLNTAALLVKNRLAKKLPVFGFGHRIYRGEDPRARILKKNAENLSHYFKNYSLLNKLEAIRHAMLPHIEHGVDVNVDFYACASYSLMGLQKDMLLPVFMISRLAGWFAHIFEQQKNNILIRPRLEYDGKINGKFHSCRVTELSHD